MDDDTKTDTTDEAEPLRPANEMRNSIDKDEWKKTNLTWKKMQIFGNRIDEVLDGSEKFLIAYGPKGIAKTTIVNLKLQAYHKRLRAVWEETDPEMRDEKDTDYDGFNVPIFKPPYADLSGRVTPIELYKILHDFREYGKVVVLDDLTDDKGVQRLIHAATDMQKGCVVRWQTNRDIIVTDNEGNKKTIDKQFNFHASLIVVTNLKQGSAEFEHMYSDALQSRSSPIFFTWDKSDITTYITKLAFEGGGLFKYMLAPDRGPTDTRGLGWKGSMKDALPILRDVRRFFLAHSPRITSPDFRLLRGLTKDRVRYGVEKGFPSHEWENYAMERVT